MEYKSSSGNVFRFNTNPRLNDLLMKLNMKMGLFKSGQTVNVDFDHVFVKTEKADYKDCWRQLPHILHTGHTQCVNVQPHTRHTRMETCWDGLAGNGSGLGHVNTVHGGFPLTHCSATDKGKGQYTWSFRWQVHLPLHHNQWLGQWREERYRNVQLI